MNHMDPSFTGRLTEAIEAHISDPSFGAKELARLLGMSHSTLFRKVRSLTGKSISQLITEIRMNKAREMLQTEDLAISEIALKVGFGSPASFSTGFRKYFGYPPGETKNNIVGTRRAVSPVTRHMNSRNNWVWLISGSELVLVLATILIFLSATRSAREKISIAVLPFRDLTQEAAGGNLCGILWEEVITTLSQIKVFDVRSAVSAGQYQGTDKSIPQIGKELKADYVIEGSVGQEGNQVKVWIQLIRSKTDDHFWEEDYTFPLSELHGKMVDLAEHTAYQLNTVLEPGERSAIQVRCSKSNESIMNYLQGNSWMDAERGMEPFKALPYYRKAIELDSTWMSPYVQLATALGIISRADPKEEYARERLKAVEKAHEISPHPWTYKALVAYYLDAGDLKKSFVIYKKAIKEFPENQTINFYMGKAGRNFGRWKQAEKMLMNFYLEYPESVQVNYGLGETYELTRDFPEALFYFNKAKSVNPDFTITYYNLAEIALKWKGDTREARKILEDEMNRNPWRGDDPIRASYLFVLADIFEGKYEEAIEELPGWCLDVPGNHKPPYNYHSRPLFYAWIYGYQGKHQLAHDYYDSTRILLESRLNDLTILQKRPEVISSLGMAYAGLGDTLHALAMAGRVGDLLSANPDGFNGPVAMEDVAWIHAKTGNHREALKIIRKLLSKPGPLTAKLLEIDPKWAPLRDQPGYKKLIDKYSIEVIDVPEETGVPTENKPIMPEITGPTFTDVRDGHVYHYDQIGSQVWMIENLAYLPAVSPPDTGSYTEKHYYVWGFDGTGVAEAKKTDNYAVYGVLYNWEAAMSACPDGWHLPSDEEWKILEKHLGMSESHADSTRVRESGSVGKKLKFTARWQNKGNGDNSAGFYAIPGGGRYFGNLFYELGICTDFWSSTEIDDSHALFRDLRNEFDGVSRYFFDKRNGFSVRCVRN